MVSLSLDFCHRPQTFSEEVVTLTPCLPKGRSQRQPSLQMCPVTAHLPNQRGPTRNAIHPKQAPHPVGRWSPHLSGSFRASSKSMLMALHIWESASRSWEKGSLGKRHRLVEPAIRRSSRMLCYLGRTKVFFNLTKMSGFPNCTAERKSRRI